MKFRMSWSVVTVFVMGVAAIWQLTDSDAVAGETSKLSAVVVAVTPVVGGGAEYVGTNKCKMCHVREYKSWKTRKHAKALDTLKPGNASDVKKKFGLDPAKDYTTDKSCLPCHTVGFGKPGGYAIPDPTDKKSVKRARYTAGIGCEVCHGAGGAFVELHTKIMKSRRKYTRDEMYASGMNKIEESTCRQCHNGKSPTIDEATYKFDYKQRLIEGVHEHYPLKYREE